MRILNFNFALICSLPDIFTKSVYLAVYILGVAYMAILPPWEGYDETAHYSYIQQIADTGARPQYETARLSTNIEEYQRFAPTPYSTVPPLDKSLGGITYKRWFEKTDSAFDVPHAGTEIKRTFTPGEIENWQAQHPPLYYLVLTPVLRATAGYSWTLQLFFLRLLSWTIAFIGFGIALSATYFVLKKIAPVTAHPVLTFSVFWPIIFPEFLPEFARLGNDSLVLLLMSLVWAFAVRRVLHSHVSWWWSAGIGVILGLGSLTKVTFLPISFAFFLWLIWFEMFSKNTCDRLSNWGRVFLPLMIFLALAGYWYIPNYLERSSITGLDELIKYNHSDSPNWFSAFQCPIEVMRGLAGMAMTFVWGSSTSSAYPPAAFVLPMVVPVLVLFPAACLAIRKFSVPLELPLLAFLAVGAVFSGLFYYLLVRVAATQYGVGAPGWYLHVLIGPLGLLLGLGWAWIRSRLKSAKLLGRISIGYSIVFYIAVMWLQLSLFTGCTVKTASSKTYSANAWACLVDFSTLYDRLALLAFPVTGMVFNIFALLTLCFALYSRRSPTANH